MKDATRNMIDFQLAGVAPTISVASLQFQFDWSAIFGPQILSPSHVYTWSAEKPEEWAPAATFPTR
jgi:hypothetical protein